VTPFRVTPGATRVWQMRIPGNTERVLIDSPAGIQLLHYGEILRTVDHIIVPIVPSPIDMRATASFLRDLFAFLKTHPNRAKVGVVANRVTRVRSLSALQRIFANIDIPCVAALSENENFVTAAEHGVSLLELDTLRGDQDRQEWEPLLRWLGETPDVVQSSARHVSPPV
jgi:chromosome partitioning protein